MTDGRSQRKQPRTVPLPNCRYGFRFIYAMISGGSPVYVGSTSDPWSRWKAHQRRWPGCSISILQEVSHSSSNAAEASWIAALLGMGFDLENKDRMAQTLKRAGRHGYPGQGEKNSKARGAP